MDNISLYTQINSLPTNLKNQVRNFVDFLKSQTDKKKEPNAMREYGALKGKIKLSSDFDAPLEDFKKY